MWKGLLLAIVMMFLVAASCLGGFVTGAGVEVGAEASCTDFEWVVPEAKDKVSEFM